MRKHLPQQRLETGGRGLLVGDSRQKFQANVDAAFNKILKEKNISLLYGLVRHIYIPKEVREPIQKGYVADELALTRTQETTTAKMEATPARGRAKGASGGRPNHRRHQETRGRDQGHGPKRGRNHRRRNRKKGRRHRPAMRRNRRQENRGLGRGRKRLQKDAARGPRPLFELAVKAFGDPTAYTKWQFAQGLPENIDLKMIYSGPGTLGPT